MLKPKGVTNSRIPAFELATYRLSFVLLTYAISYLLYPRRVLRTIRNLVGGGNLATVFENRLQDTFQRGRVAGGATVDS